jgi:hypothetical protein
MDDERYRIPGTNMFNLSKWSRENVPKSPPRYKVGDVVVHVTDDEVLRVFEDCDGTPLYELARGGSGISDDWLLPGHADDWQLAGAIELAGVALSRVEPGGGPGRITALENLVREMLPHLEWTARFDEDQAALVKRARELVGGDAQE